MICECERWTLMTPMTWAMTLGSVAAFACSTPRRSTAIVTVRPNDDTDFDGSKLIAADVCERVYEELEYPPEWLKVVWQGRLVEESERLNELGVRTESLCRSLREYHHNE